MQIDNAKRTSLKCPILSDWLNNNLVNFHTVMSCPKTTKQNHNLKIIHNLIKASIWSTNIFSNWAAWNFSAKIFRACCPENLVCGVNTIDRTEYRVYADSFDCQIAKPNCRPTVLHRSVPKHTRSAVSVLLNFNSPKAAFASKQKRKERENI